MMEGSKAAEREERGWQRRLLPFMMGSLTVMGLLFFAATIWHFQEMQRRFTYESPDIQKILRELEQLPAAKTDPSYRDWHARVVFESTALGYRYQQNAAVIYSRAWTGYMGFLTGMVLALSGCVFILGKLREAVQFSGEAQNIKWALVTSSPGLVLALTGAVLVGLSLNLKVKIESNDQPVYIPQLMQTPAITAPAAPPPSPAALPGGAGQVVKPRAPMPPGVEGKIGKEAGETK